MKKFENEKMNLLLEFLLLNSLFYILDIFYKTKIVKENNELKSYFFYFLILPIFFSETIVSRNRDIHNLYHKYKTKKFIFLYLFVKKVFFVSVKGRILMVNSIAIIGLFNIRLGNSCFIRR